MTWNPGPPCPHILTWGKRAGEVCGKPSNHVGWCQQHGPGGRLAQQREATRERRGTCEQVNVRGKRKGQTCGAPVTPGKSVCHRHDPDLVAKRQAARTVPRCKATIRATGQQCKKDSMPGLDVCYRHGGAYPANKAKSAAFVAEREARRELSARGVDMGAVTNALVAFQHHVAKMIAWRDYCEEMVTALDPSDMRYKSQQDLEQLRAEVQMYQRALQDTSAGLAALARVQVDERLAAIREATLLMLLSALRDALTKAGLDTNTAAIVKAEFAKKVRVIEGKVDAAAIEAA